MPHPLQQPLNELITERDDLARRVDELRAEALAWRAKAEKHAKKYRVSVETDDPAIVGAMGNLINCNAASVMIVTYSGNDSPYANEED